MTRLTLDQALERAGTLMSAGRNEDAREIYAAVARAFPDDPRARQALVTLDNGSAARQSADTLSALRDLCRQGRFEDAIRQAEGFLQDRPDSHETWILLGGACTQTGRLERAETAFNRAIAIRPEASGAHYNLGLVQQRAGRLHDALRSYKRALRRNPGHADAHNNMGNVLADLGRPEEAETAYSRALQVRPKNADIFSNLGRALKELGRLDEAAAAWERALKLVPHHSAALSQKLRLGWESCDFSAHTEFSEVRASLGIDGGKIPPFALLAAEDEPMRQRLRSQRWSQDIRLTAAPPAAPRPERRPDKLRVGYFSAHFHDHPTLRLVSGLLREHDRSRFEIFAYSFGRQKSGDLRARLRQDVPDFHDVEHFSPGQVADLARSHRLDIAIDLDGYIKDARPEIFAHRPAGIAIAHLGFPGTMAAEFIDYLVADPTVIPASGRAHYAESIIRLPDSYQPNDDQRPVPETTDTRADHGLPTEGVVFCCFNNSYKIGPREFDVWMRLLGRVDGSVLWLLRSNARMAANLAAEASGRGVDPSRLVFAERVPQGAHLARHLHADLFLDSFHYNAHTTCSDALWAGLPVVTMAGRQFAARVGASLLTAIGLEDLVTTTAADYEALALDLATMPDRLAEVRGRLAHNRLTSPLFDTARYARHFEAGIDAAFGQYLRGEPTRDIHVQRISES